MEPRFLKQTAHAEKFIEKVKAHADTDPMVTVRMWSLWLAMHNLHRQQMEAQKNG